jgi:hypothetical protein
MVSSTFPGAKPQAGMNRAFGADAWMDQTATVRRPTIKFFAHHRRQLRQIMPALAIPDANSVTSYQPGPTAQETRKAP